MSPDHADSPGGRILVIANETVESTVLHEAIRASVAGAASTRLLVVTPALNSRLRHWLSDEDGARAAAAQRLRRCVDRLEAAGVEVDGWVGDADPLQAIADALRLFDADRIVIATHPEGRSNWLARRLPERARRRFALPIVHVVVDTAGSKEYLLDHVDASAAAAAS
jgi:nucleotide-binding universal stress UspA family protein